MKEAERLQKEKGDNYNMRVLIYSIKYYYSGNEYRKYVQFCEEILRKIMRA